MMTDTNVKDLMEEQIITIGPDDSLADAARKMKEANCGCLPVGAPGNPEGIITDRDIVVRAIADNLDPATEKVRDYMTCTVKSCNTTDTLADAAEKMRESGVSRLLVTDDEGRTVGLLSFGRILRNHDDAQEITAVITCATGGRGFLSAKGKTVPSHAGAH